MIKIRNRQTRKVDELIQLTRKYYQEGNLRQAEIACKNILRIQKKDFITFNNLGCIIKEQGRADEALQCFVKSININPSYAKAFYNLGTILHEKKQLDEAIEYFKKAIQLDPDYAMAYYNIGRILHQEKKQTDEAVAYYQKALLVNQDIADAHYGLGIVCHERNQLDKAIACYQKAIQLNPDSAEIHWNLSLALLSAGNYREGWKEFEWRHKQEDYFQYKYSQPVWDGFDINGRTILIHTEQGFGDSIQFIRYAPFVAQRGAKVLLHCRKELASLLRNVEGIEHATTETEELPEFDTLCSILKLPLIFRTTLETIPAEVPYITVDPQISRKWRDKLKCSYSKMKVGLTWAGRPEHKNDSNRSCSIKLFSILGETENVVFYSLQKRDAGEEAKDSPEGLNLIDYMDEVDNFADTAALIENLDLIISVDTAVAHLAGSLGKPVWTLIPFVSDWRWMLHREDSPWYPTMRLFRQPSPGDWESVIAKVKDELLKLS